MNGYKIVSEEEYAKREKRMDKILKKYMKNIKSDEGDISPTLFNF